MTKDEERQVVKAARIVLDWWILVPLLFLWTWLFVFLAGCAPAEATDPWPKPGPMCRPSSVATSEMMDMAMSPVPVRTIHLPKLSTQGIHCVCIGPRVGAVLNEGTREECERTCGQR